MGKLVPETTVPEQQENGKLIELRGISKSFDGEPVLKDFNLFIRDKEFVTLPGPSGCG